MLRVTRRVSFRIAATLAASFLLLAWPGGAPTARAQAPGGAPSPEVLKEKLAAAKQAAAANQVALRQYTWKERTALSLKGEEKTVTLAQVSHDATGKPQKTTISETTPEKKGGLRGKIIESKKEELKEYMGQVKALVAEYVPPTAERMQDAFAKGYAAFTKPDSGTVALKFTDYVRPGDHMTLLFDAAGQRIRRLEVSSTLENKDPVSMLVDFHALPDKTTYPAVSTIDAPAKHVQLKVEQLDFQKVAH